MSNYQTARAKRAADALWVAIQKRSGNFSSAEAGFIWRTKFTVTDKFRTLSPRKYTWLNTLAAEKCRASDYYVDPDSDITHVAEAQQGEPITATTELGTAMHEILRRLTILEQRVDNAAKSFEQIRNGEVSDIFWNVVQYKTRGEIERIFKRAYE